MRVIILTAAVPMLLADRLMATAVPSRGPARAACAG